MIVNIRKTKIKAVDRLPEQEGFEFISFRKDGTFFYNKIFKGNTGKLLYSRYREVVGWLPIITDDGNKQRDTETMAIPEEQGRRKSNSPEIWSLCI